MQHLERGKLLLDQYLYRCELFGLLSPDDKARMANNLPKDPQVLRTLKIQRYQVEKEVKAKLKDIHGYAPLRSGVFQHFKELGNLVCLADMLDEQVPHLSLMRVGGGIWGLLLVFRV